MSQERSISNWLGLGAILLLMVALIRLSGGEQPEAELAAEQQRKVSTAASSPLPATRSAHLTSPLRPALSAVDTKGQLATIPADAAHTSLTVLHTNDTWGYLTPCG